MFALATITLDAPISAKISKGKPLTLDHLDLCYHVINGLVYAQIARIPNAIQLFAADGATHTSEQCTAQTLEILGADIGTSIAALFNAEMFNGATVISQKEFSALLQIPPHP